MSEKLYALLLRMYPSHFRQEYGEEAMRLFRDRAGDERGFLPRLRLWMDMFFDFTISLPREYLHVPSPRVASPVVQRVYGLPVLYVLHEESPRPAALFLGGMVSLVALTTCWASLGYVHSVPSPALSQFAENRGERSQGRNDSARSLPGDPSASTRSLSQKNSLDADQRKRIVSSAAANLQQHYFDRAAAEKMAGALSAHEKHGDYDAVTDPATFAALLTQQMREVNADRHLTLDYFQDPLPQQPAGQTPEVLAQYRETMKRQNCAFERIELLSRNIGYVKLNSFPDLQVCRVATMAAMTYVNHADAIIFDLRDNRGGNPETVQFIGSYLFDHPEYWYNPRENTSEQSWTRSPVAGNDLADKLVFVLTSANTISGAEQFCYDLKMLKRATLIGETTGGAAHSGIWHRIDDHFGMGIPEAKAINPYSSPDWAEIGVEPDVNVRASDALDAALKLAKNKLQKK